MVHVQSVQRSIPHLNAKNKSTQVSELYLCYCNIEGLPLNEDCRALFRTTLVTPTMVCNGVSSPGSRPIAKAAVRISVSPMAEQLTSPLTLPCLLGTVLRSKSQRYHSAPGPQLSNFIHS